MIVVDTSIFVAILAEEPDAQVFADALARSADSVMSAGNYLEARILAETRFQGRSDLDGWLTERRIDIVPVDRALAEIAADAFARYGKGRHPAGLNYGDCFAYALAKQMNAPLLFKGNDFSRTDVAAALV